MTLFVVGAVLGFILLIIEAIRNQWSLVSVEGLLSLVIYPAVVGWLACFAWKVIQWPFS